MTQEMRKKFIGVSSTGTNAAVKGFTGKIKEMIAILLLPKDDNPSLIYLGLMSMGSPGGFRADENTYEWSMNLFKTEIEQDAGGSDESREAWDELEKSVLAKLADEVKISIVGTTVEITINKEF